jgi:hypothetical protein
VYVPLVARGSGSPGSVVGMEPVRPRELVAAARVADALVYAAGVAGIVAGALLFRDGQPGFAVVAWALAFVAGAALRLASWCAKALAQLLTSTDRLREDVADLRRTDLGPGATPPRDPDVPDPYRRWGGWH